MDIRIKRFSKEVPLPQYHTAGAAGFDLAARERVEIPAGAVGYVPLNVAVETPSGYFLLIAARSSTHKKGLILANGIGIGDSDFCGDGDEYKAAYFNFTSTPVVVEKGDRIAQGVFVKYETAQWSEVDVMGNKDRGGFGGTGAR